jgi:AcrR family transcriptional regulator
MRRLMAGGADPSVADVAEAAGISRTTAYRYFPEQLSLVQAALPETANTSLLADDAPHDVVERLERTLDEHFRFIRRWEPQLRAALRYSLQPGVDQPALRGGRAIAWYRDALDPLRTQRPDIDLGRLAVRLRAAAGIEPYIWLTDVAGLRPTPAFAAMRDNARAILEAALAQPRPR